MGDASTTLMRVLRLLPVLPLLAGLTVVGTVTSVGPTVLGCASAASAHHAAVVIQHSSGSPYDGVVLEYCIGFDSDTVTGQDLLNILKAPPYNLDVQEQNSSSMGEAVCRIDDEPEQYPSGCWTASSPYWAMYVSRGDGAWNTSDLGVSSQTFADGDAMGFIYESQSSRVQPPPPAGICPAPTLTPTPTATAAPTARPTATPHATASPPGSRGATSPAATSAGASGSPSPALPAPTSAPATASALPPSSSATPDVTVIAGTPGVPPPSPPAPGPGWLVAAALAALLLARLAVVARRQRASRAATSP